MGLFKRKYKFALIFIGTSLCLALAFVFYLLNFGQTISKSGTLKLEGLKKPVQVLTDKYGIPHIKALNDHDMMMALGYIMASDRLWQMDLLRRIGSGRLSEILGPKLLKTDIFLRKLGLSRHMKELWAEQKKTAPPHMLMQIEAYLKGVNSYVKNGPKPLEMKLLGYTADEFKMEDALSVAGYMALSFAEGFFVDVMYTDLLDELTQLDVDLIFPRMQLEDNLPKAINSKTEKSSTDYANHYKLKTKINVNSNPNSRSNSNQALQNLRSQSISPNDLNYIYEDLANIVSDLKSRFGMFQGSNSWVLSGQRTQSGKPILANDPHIAYASPSVFYEAHIQSPTYENYGHYIPLIPFPGLGHNKDRAWAITMSKSDDLDYFKEIFHPTEPKVLFKNKYVAYKVYKEEIFIKGKNKSHIEEVIVTPHGPMLDGTKYVKEGQSLSLSWQFLNPTNNPALSFYLLSQSKELDDLAPALKHTAAPGFNISFVDSKGNIGWHVMGKIPVLPKPSSGLKVRIGHTGEDDYVRYLDIMENPHIYNPESGVIISANYKHEVEGPIPWIGLWQPKDRLIRLNDLLSKKEKWDLESLKKVQTDEHVAFHKTFVDEFFSEVVLQTDFEKEIYQLLNKWNGDSSLDSVESSIYHTISLTLLRNLIADELGEERFEIYASGSDPFAFLFQVLRQKKTELWDNIKTDHIETIEEVINKTYIESLNFLKNKLGRDYKKWTLKRLKTVEFKHVLGRFFPLDAIFNLGPYPVAGGANQVNAMGLIRSDLSFGVFYGPATRRLIDLNDASQSFGVLPTGNSGNRSSKHYSDQIKLLVNNKYRIQNMNFDKLEAPIQKLTLKP